MFEGAQRMPTSEHILALRRKYGVSADWLLDGTGPMLTGAGTATVDVGALARDLAASNREVAEVRRELSELKEAVRAASGDALIPSEEETRILESLRSLPENARKVLVRAILAEAAEAPEPAAGETSRSGAPARARR